MLSLCWSVHAKCLQSALRPQAVTPLLPFGKIYLEFDDLI